MKEISAGGVVIHKNDVLILKKYRGEWVLPKGRIEDGEDLEDTAIREVREESGLTCEIKRYIGFVRYNYRDNDGREIHKTVHYYYMQMLEGELDPQKEEGFKSAAFIHYDKAINLVKHYAEKNMIQRAFEWHENGNY